MYVHTSVSNLSVCSRLVSLVIICRPEERVDSIVNKSSQKKGRNLCQGTTAELVRRGYLEDSFILHLFGGG